MKIYYPQFRLEKAQKHTQQQKNVVAGKNLPYTVSPYFPPHKVTYRGPDAGEVFIHKIHEENIWQVFPSHNIFLLLRVFLGFFEPEL